MRKWEGAQVDLEEQSGKFDNSSVNEKEGQRNGRLGGGIVKNGTV